jgi:hypothetical protein
MRLYQSRTFVQIHMHENRLYIIEATVPASAAEPGLFQQSPRFSRRGRATRAVQRQLHEHSPATSARRTGRDGGPVGQRAAARRTDAGRQTRRREDGARSRSHARQPFVLPVTRPHAASCHRRKVEFSNAHTALRCTAIRGSWDLGGDDFRQSRERLRGDHRGVVHRVRALECRSVTRCGIQHADFRSGHCEPTLMGW